MKLLIDENLPKRLKIDFPDHEIFTVSDKSWNSKKNGELLELMFYEGFDFLLLIRIFNTSKTLKNIPFLF